MTAFKLPFDIVESIIELVHDDNDVASLHACALTCHTFLSVCRKHIFSKVELSTKNHSSFRRLLDTDPSIAGYVRSLRYQTRLPDSSDEAPVLQNFRCISSFALGFPFMERNWNKISWCLESSLSSFIQRNNITKLTLYCIEDLPLSFFNYFPHLATLELGVVSIVNVPLSNNFDKSKGLLELTSFSIGDCDWRPLSPIIDFRGLEELSINTNSRRDDTAEGLKPLLRPSETLKSLSLGSYPALYSLGDISRSLSLGSMKSLKTVKLSLSLDTVNDDPYHHFTHELEEIAGKNFLENLIININVDAEDRCTTEAIRWSQLDLVLSQPNGFPSLQHVDLKVTISYYDPVPGMSDFQAQLEEIGRKHLPWLKDNKQMKFHFGVRNEQLSTECSACQG